MSSTYSKPTQTQLTLKSEMLTLIQRNSKIKSFDYQATQKGRSAPRVLGS